MVRAEPLRFTDDAKPVIARSPAGLLAILGLPTGAALLVFFVSGLSLAAGLVLTTTGVAGLGTFVWRRLDVLARKASRQRLKVGIAAGALATVVYDVSRFALVGLLGLDLDPWEALPYFGQLITGQELTSPVARTVGFVFHAANGVGFAVAYTFLLGRRGIVTGVGWALSLEVAMLTFYPGWLDIRAFEELASISMIGHVLYGLTLGAMSQRVLLRIER